MPRLGIGDLPLVPCQFDPAYAPESQFETLVDARNEDRTRAHSLRRYKPRDRVERIRAKRLAQRLEQSGQFPKSFASSRYMRKMRRIIIGRLWKLLPVDPAIPVATVTIIPKGWAVGADALNRVDPRKLMAQIRTDLNRAGGDQATGWGFFFLHGEFESVSRRYVPHVHGVVVGDMIDVIDNLAKGNDGKQRAKYTSTATRDPSDGRRATHRRFAQAARQHAVPVNLYHEILLAGARNRHGWR